MTFILYFAVNGFRLNTISIIAKGAELALIVLLLSRRGNRRALLLMSRREE